MIHSRLIGRSSKGVIMIYKGLYKIFDSRNIKTYPLHERINKTTLEDLVLPDNAKNIEIKLPEEIERNIKLLAKDVTDAAGKAKPVILFTGAHLIKNGLGPLLIDLIKKKILTLVAGNCATAIHDFEIGLIGQTSEYVPQALEKGQFGMSFEFNLINAALSLGNKLSLGFGETIGRFICEKSFREQVFLDFEKDDFIKNFSYPEYSIAGSCFNSKIPFTVHVSIGTDVIDQHYTFNGCDKGGCSGRDFLIFTEGVKGFSGGGVYINIGSAVTGPEVLLKAISMVSNTGNRPKGVTFADFDLRPLGESGMKNDDNYHYYFRDQKSIVTRIPEAFNGKGYYIEGNQKETFVLFYQEILKNLPM